MKFKIEKNVPMTKSRRAGKYSEGAIQYPWDSMDVGDSFAIKDAALAARVRVAANCVNTKGQKYFTTRTTANGYRCWRIR
jgi:hypothetical protein